MISYWYFIIIECVQGGANILLFCGFIGYRAKARLRLNKGKGGTGVAAGDDALVYYVLTHIV